MIRGSRSAARPCITASISETDFQRADVPEADLWAFTDSALRNPGYSSYGNLSNSTMLFSFSQRSYTMKEWLDFARARPGRPRAGSSLSDKDLFQRYIERTAMDYYRNHLEQYNKDFAFQLNEFKEGNLLIRDHAAKDLGQGFDGQCGVGEIL